MGLLLETKSDEIYTNERFQREKYKKYSSLLKEMYDNPSNYSDSVILSNLLEVGAYILNSVHYYQKFKLKCDLLHPLDLQLVIEKVKNKKYKRKVTSSNNINEECIIDERLNKMEE